MVPYVTIWGVDILPNLMFVLTSSCHKWKPKNITPYSSPIQGTQKGIGSNTLIFCYLLNNRSAPPSHASPVRQQWFFYSYPGSLWPSSIPAFFIPQSAWKGVFWAVVCWSHLAQESDSWVCIYLLSQLYFSDIMLVSWTWPHGIYTLEINQG